jgi:hypothetical protein
LKKAGCRVTALDKAIAKENGDTGGRGQKQADILIDLARTNPLKTNAGTAADGADANRPPQSAPEKAGAPGWRERL